MVEPTSERKEEGRITAEQYPSLDLLAGKQIFAGWAVPPCEDCRFRLPSRLDDHLFDCCAGYWISIGSPVSSFHACFWSSVSRAMTLVMFSFCVAALLFRAFLRSCSLASLLNAPANDVPVAATMSRILDFWSLVSFSFSSTVELAKTWSPCACKLI